MKKLITLILSFCLTIIPFNGVFANSDSDLEAIGILSKADELKLIQNNDEFGEAYAVLNNLKHTIKWNKKTNEVFFTVEDLRTRGNIENSSFNIEINEDFKPMGTIKYNDEEHSVQNIDTNMDARFVAALPVIVGSALITALIQASATVIVAGVTYVLATEIASALRKKNYKHYQATVKYSSKLKRNDLFIGNALGETGASGRLKAGNDVWSTSKSGAQKIAKLAGGGKTPVGAEKHGNGKPGYYWHYHTYNRKGGHSFY
ncbi:hypothetical protein [Paraclostridium sordellii]|uniref:hypothetical protein n=1 Tax=Paraclostridium sordellii TaxID=1505 RepID=UPI000385459C|nr:hypothetical protein [Paeniclostridium sordellii]AUO31649.1 hypothetical protein [Paeniclostridium sordellii]AUO31743.1 hypothetical protein [Paeniclostridium sordellii]EPZ61120.1 hypothetical protein H476_0316 [[Clostridium] sordellii VPI 9048] [Paeniclostridium sordellii VPI 9048]CEK40090.1 hypothetical protein JGS6382_PCS1300491 (plasmid) [[Clostridium] sordellii] [Paeniclostridium sordellii]